MPDARPQPRFSLAVHAYLGFSLAIVVFLPLFVVTATTDGVPFRTAGGIAASAWAVALGLLFLYAKQACSGDTMSFKNGLLWITASMMTGWTYFSFATVLPALLGAFSGAVFFALSGDLRRDKKYAPERWLLLVRFFYRHRLRQ